MTDKSPLVTTLAISLDAQGTTAVLGSTLGEVPFNGTVTGCSFTPNLAIVGGATNYRTLSVVNKGTDGSGTTVIGTKAFNVAATAAASDEIALTLDSARVTVTQGQILGLSESIAAGGIPNPGGLFEVELTRG